MIQGFPPVTTSPSLTPLYSSLPPVFPRLLFELGEILKQTQVRLNLYKGYRRGNKIFVGLGEGFKEEIILKD